MRKRLAVVVGVFVVSRVILGFLAVNPTLYGSSYAQVTTDIQLYESWAYEIVVQNRAPYASFPMEYPPGAVPFVAVPSWDQSSAAEYEGGLYVPRFVGLMLLVDLAGFAGLLVLSRRWKSDFGLWVWIGGVFLLGPITYARLDLVPAVATIWAVERASAGSWFGTGGWLGFGILTKVYPLFIAPIAVVAAPRRKQVLAGLAVVSVLLVLPYAGSAGDLLDSVAGFHSQRGVHVESIWGTLLVLASKLGLEAVVMLSHGAFHVESTLMPAAKAVGTAAAVAVVVVATRRAARVLRPGDAPAAAAMMFGTLALLLGVGTVFSPQFLIWILALGAAAACFPNDGVKAATTLLFPIALATQIVYPFIYEHVVAANPYAILFVACRDLLVVLAGLGAWAAVKRPALEDPVSTSPARNIEVAVSD